MSKTSASFFLRSSLRIFVLFLLGANLSGWANAQDYAKYQSYDEMTKSLKQMVKSGKKFAKLESIGKTLQGRNIWLVTLANPDGAALNDRPGLLAAANFEGDHLIGSQLSLEMIDYLLKNYSTDAEVKKTMDEHVYYFIPRMNPDGAEAMFAKIKTGKKTNAHKFDDDNDGRLDEDGPEDLNKDGYITVMRLKDANGRYMVDPKDARLMKKADPAQGETGVYKLYWEGVDNDGDGFIDEDPPGGTDLNRNFQHAYPYYKPDAGKYMVSEAESRALMDWVVAHRNVAAVLTFSESDNLIVPPNAKGKLSSDKSIDLFQFAGESNSEVRKVGMITAPRRFGRFGGMSMFRRSQQQQSGRSRIPRKPVTTVNKADLAYFTKISKKYREITGIKNQPPLRTPEGAFFQYGYFQYGVPSFSTPGWGLHEPAGKKEKTAGSMGSKEGVKAGSSAMRGRMMGAGRGVAKGNKRGMDAKLLKWMDREKINGFIDWQTFKHPTLGQVEIGGFIPYAVTNPPAGRIKELGEKHGKFAVYLSSLFPRIRIAKTEVENHGGGIFTVKAEIENSGFLPTALQHGVVSGSVKPTMVQLEVKPDQIISGNNKTNFFQSLAGSKNRQKYEWIIKGKTGAKIELKVVSQKAGSDKTVITLQ